MSEQYVRVPRELLRENIEYLRGMGGTHDQKSAFAAKFESILLDPATEKDLRKQYEDWADENGYDITRNDHGDYAGIVEDSMWTGWQAHDEMRALLAAPTEDVRAVGEEPVLWFKRLTGLQAKANGQCYDVMFSEVPGYSPLYQRRACVMPDREALSDAIAQAIGVDAYDCTRVWQAWGVGTMSEDDFVPITDQEERLKEIVDACIDEFERLNKC